MSGDMNIERLTGSVSSEDVDLVGLTDAFQAWGDLRSYLEAHECDIAVGVDDFDSLRLLFRVVLGRKAEE